MKFVKFALLLVVVALFLNLVGCGGVQPADRVQAREEYSRADHVLHLLVGAAAGAVAREPRLRAGAVLHWFIRRVFQPSAPEV